MNNGPVFEIGTMAGLMTVFRRHSVIMTNFSIFMAESRPYWVQEGISAGAGAGVCGGPGTGLECPGDTVMPAWATGWALAIPMYAGRVVPGWV